MTFNFRYSRNVGYSDVLYGGPFGVTWAVQPCRDPPCSLERAPVSKLLRFMDHDRYGRWARIVMDDGDPCWISIAQTGVLVKKSRIGLFGAKLYQEKNLYQAARTGQALASLYPEKRTPTEMQNLVLVAFVNAVLHCRHLTEVTRVLNEAPTLEKTSPSRSPQMPDPSAPFDSALLKLGNRLRADFGLGSCESVTDAVAIVLTKITISAITEAGQEHFPHPTASTITNASVGACFMAACLMGISIRLEERGIDLDVQDAFDRAGFAVFKLYRKEDQAQIISAGGNIFKELVGQISSHAALKEWLEGVELCTASYVLTGDNAWVALLGELYVSLAAIREQQLA